MEQNQEFGPIKLAKSGTWVGVIFGYLGLERGNDVGFCVSNNVFATLPRSIGLASSLKRTTTAHSSLKYLVRYEK